MVQKLYTRDQVFELLSWANEDLDNDQVNRKLATLRETQPSDGVREAVEAFTALLETHDEDIGMDEYGDNQSVGSQSGPNPDDPIVDMPLTFGILRRARKALAALGEGEVRP